MTAGSTCTPDAPEAALEPTDATASTSSGPIVDTINADRIKGLHPAVEPLARYLMTPLPDASVLAPLHDVATAQFGKALALQVIHVVKRKGGYFVIGGMRAFQIVSVLRATAKYPFKVTVFIWPDRRPEILRVFAAFEALMTLASAQAEHRTRHELADAVASVFELTRGARPGKEVIAGIVGTSLRTIQRAEAVRRTPTERARATRRRNRRPGPRAMARVAATSAPPPRATAQPDSSASQRHAGAARGPAAATRAPAAQAEASAPHTPDLFGEAP